MEQQQLQPDTHSQDLASQVAAEQSSFKNIFQCANCKSIIFSNVRHIHRQNDRLVLLEFDSLSPGVDIAENDYSIGDQGAFDYLSIYSRIQCKQCQFELGRVYFSTTKELDHLKQKILVFEDKVFCFDLLQNRQVMASETFPGIISENTYSFNENRQPPKQQDSGLHTPAKLSKSHNSIRVSTLKKNLDAGSQAKPRGNQAEMGTAQFQQYFEELENSMNFFTQILECVQQRIVKSESYLQALDQKINKVTDHILKSTAQ